MPDLLLAALSLLATAHTDNSGLFALLLGEYLLNLAILELFLDVFLGEEIEDLFLFLLDYFFSLRAEAGLLLKELAVRDQSLAGLYLLQEGVRSIC